MRIDHAYTRFDPTPGAVKKAPTTSGGTVAGVGEGAEDRGATTVSLSPRARELAEGGRIAALRSAIERGDFRVDAQRIAAKLVGEDT